MDRHLKSKLSSSFALLSVTQRGLRGILTGRSNYRRVRISTTPSVIYRPRFFGVKLSTCLQNMAPLCPGTMVGPGSRNSCTDLARITRSSDCRGTLNATRKACGMDWPIGSQYINSKLMPPIDNPSSLRMATLEFFAMGCVKS